MNDKVHVYAVVRIDAELSDEASVTIKEILPTMEQAAAEVARLNQLNESKGAHYFWQVTRYFPSGRHIESRPPSSDSLRSAATNDLPQVV